MTLCAVTKTEPNGDDLQSTALRSTDDDDDSDDDDDDDDNDDDDDDDDK